MESFTNLQRLRKRAYQLMEKGRGSLSDLMDAVLTNRSDPTLESLWQQYLRRFCLEH